MQLKIKPIAIDTFRENVLILSRDCRALRPERLKGTRKVEVTAGDQRIIASVVVADDAATISGAERYLAERLKAKGREAK